MDEDCDGVVDNFDMEKDGFCDCLSIGILGNPGSNPSANFQDFLESKGTVTDRLFQATGDTLVAGDLDDYQVVIVDRVPRMLTAEEAQVIYDYVAGGGGLISMAGYENSGTQRGYQNSAISVLGTQYAAPIFLSPTEVYVTPHPITDGVSGVQVYGGWTVNGPGESWVYTQENGPDDSLGRLADLGDGSYIVFSDEWISFDSEWVAIPGVLTLWQNMINAVTPDQFCVNPQ